MEKRSGNEKNYNNPTETLGSINYSLTQEFTNTDPASKIVKNPGVQLQSHLGGVHPSFHLN